MVELADTLNGWTKSVYKFGCAFIHLSSFHDYHLNDPFESLDATEASSIKAHLHNYHDFSMDSNLTVQTITPILTSVFHKISSNLECYIESLERGEIRQSVLI